MVAIVQNKTKNTCNNNKSNQNADTKMKLNGTCNFCEKKDTRKKIVGLKLDNKSKALKWFLDL